MKLAVKQLAWLHAVPKPPDRKKKARDRSRLGNLIKDGRKPQMPDAPCRYLIDILFEVGPSMPGAMGSVPLSELELLAWQINRCHFLQPWEIQFVRRLSAEFIAMQETAADSTCPAPWRPDRLSAREAQSVTSSLMADLRGAAS